MEPRDIAIGDIIQTTFNTRWQQQEYLNVIHWKVQELGGAGAQYASYLDALNSYLVTAGVGSFITPYLPCIGNNATFRHVDSQRVFAGRDYYIRTVVGQAGTYAGTCDAGNVSAVITKRSSRAGRGRAGSFHVSAPPTTDTMENGLWTVAYLNVLNPLADFLNSDISSPGSVGVLRIGMWNPMAAADQNFSRVLDTRVEDTIRVVRRRTVGVGI